VMIADGRPSLATAPAVVLVPGAAVFLTVYSLNLVGDRVRARLTNESRFL
jgi:ABC-type dipeptide/oligopeptide/nickel transport system permease subunit